jgi:hypothetical protein
MLGNESQKIKSKGASDQPDQSSMFFFVRFRINEVTISLEAKRNENQLRGP